MHVYSTESFDLKQNEPFPLFAILVFMMLSTCTLGNLYFFVPQSLAEVVLLAKYRTSVYSVPRRGGVPS